MSYLKIHPTALGVSLGVLEGLPISLATIILVRQGETGATFLSKLFPFYDLSWRGALIGLVAGFIDGFIGGLIMAWIYNALVERSNNKRKEI